MDIIAYASVAQPQRRVCQLLHIFPTYCCTIAGEESCEGRSWREGEVRLAVVVAAEHVRKGLSLIYQSNMEVPRTILCFT